jgi:hypothetical protein
MHQQGVFQPSRQYLKAEALDMLSTLQAQALIHLFLKPKSSAALPPSESAQSGLTGSVMSLEHFGEGHDFDDDDDESMNNCAYDAACVSTLI